MTPALAAQLRIDSLGVTMLLFAAGVIAANPRFRASRDVGRLAPMRVELDVVDRDGEHFQDVLTPATIGRGADADVVVDDPDASRHHARLEAENGIVYVTDLESANGTFLNGRRLRQAIEVRPGDRIDVGTTRLVVKEIVPWT
ncbi:MAG TPA: FHA domain-containing protein [Candidatus Dormibacteraeota bacterium]|nr:FHA domain-containing protein [Candidatus Dormibacteraeota bacterium]